jgi:hypothetical protein
MSPEGSDSMTGEQYWLLTHCEVDSTAPLYDAACGKFQHMLRWHRDARARVAACAGKQQYAGGCCIGASWQVPIPVVVFSHDD